jgi:dye decolorizing peroxidase
VADAADGVDRRRFLRASAVTAGGAAAGAVVGVLADRAVRGEREQDADRSGQVRSLDPVPYFGRHQPGIAGRAPSALRFAAYDLRTASTRADVRALLQRVGSAAASMMSGRWIAEQGDVAAGLRPDGLTITVGLGGAAVQAVGHPVPEQLRPLPVFRGDELVPARSGGDLAIQICAADEQLVVSATRAMERIVGGAARVRWVQRGFLPGSALVNATETPRNLMGQHDGTDNPTGSKLDLAVWVTTADQPDWLVDGTYLVCRRIRMLLPEWEALPTAKKEAALGRHLDSGAPLSGGEEHTPPDFTARAADGTTVIPADAHVRLTHPANNSGATMLRRGYAYDDGYRSDGHPDAGLFFQAFQRDPLNTFVPVQRKLAETDALSRFLRHESSAVFALPPGAREGGFVGETLFA